MIDRIRLEDPSTHFREAGWEEALNLAADGLRRIRDRDEGGAPVGFGSAKCSTDMAAGARVRVSTRRGAADLRARADGAVPAGLVFIPIYYAQTPANLLTNQTADLFGKITELEFCSARVEAL
jgi:predicted molibdopterin-dependent oxidoreductase YjgC